MPRKNKIVIRSGSAVPSAGDFVAGEPAWDSTAGKLYVKNAAGAMVEIGAGTSDSRFDLFLPPAPTSISATAGNAQATVTWAAPTVLAQTPITDYVVQYSSNSGSTWTTFSDGTSTSTSATITGLTNGTAYSVRVAAINGIGQGAWSSTASVTPVAGDTLWSNVRLLLSMDGSNNGTSFNDSSLDARTVTRAGSPVTATATKKYGTASGYFSASGDYLSVADASSLELGSGDFAIEMWINTTNSSQYSTLISRCPNSFGSGMWTLMMNHNSATAGDLALYVGDISTSTPHLSGGSGLRDGAWHHVAVSRSGSTWNLYVDGTRVATATSSATIADISGDIRIGGDQFYGRQYVGYIDDLRITSVARYTGASITVPISAMPSEASGTDSLFSNVSLLLHMNGTGSTFTDSSGSPKTITANGSAAQSTAQTRFSGKSLLLSAVNNQYLSLPSSAAFNFSGDFTIEAWVYPTSYQTYATLLEGRTSASYQNYICGLWYNNGVYVLDFVTDGGAPGRLTASSTTVALNQWSHIAWVRSGTTLRCYVNGTQDDSAVTYSTAINAAASTLTIGKNVDGNYFDGYIDEYRVTKAARYTASFTPPTAAFPDS